MQDLRELVGYYVERLSGPEAENAWHSLVEEGPAALPYLLNSFGSAEDKEVQIRLLQIVCQYRSEEAIPFLAGNYTIQCLRFGKQRLMPWS